MRLGIKNKICTRYILHKQSYNVSNKGEVMHTNTKREGKERFL